jgi:dipeptidase E
MKHIIAMGGGGFSMEPENLLLDQYVLNQTEKSNPKICFVPTASGESQEYILNFYKAFENFTCRPTYLSLFRPPTSDLEDFILEKDVFYVGGGNTKSMLALWREWGLDRVFRKAWESGIILTGLSAGAICWFEQGVTDSVPGILGPLKCVGLLKGSFCPHYDGEQNRRPAYQHLVSRGEVLSGYAADDGVAFHYIDNGISQVVSSRPEAKGYRVEKTADAFEESEMRTQFLGEKEYE